MRPLEVKLPHSLEPAEVRRRIEAAVARAGDDFGDSVGDLSATWHSEDRMELRMSVLGTPIEGELHNAPGELVVRVTLPALAALFAGRIRSGIEERLGGLLVSRPA
jgi:hypothetical protein